MTTEEILEQLDPLKHDFKERLEEFVDRKIQDALDNYEPSSGAVYADDINDLSEAIERCIKRNISFSVSVD